MTYNCGQCHKEVHQIRLSNDRKYWLCDKCYFTKDKEVVKYNNHGTKFSRTA